MGHRDKQRTQLECLPPTSVPTPPTTAVPEVCPRAGSAATQSKASVAVVTKTHATGVVAARELGLVHHKLWLSGVCCLSACSSARPPNSLTHAPSATRCSSSSASLGRTARCRGGNTRLLHADRLMQAQHSTSSTRLLRRSRPPSLLPSSPALAPTTVFRQPTP